MDAKDAAAAQRPGYYEQAPILLVAVPWRSRTYILAELQEQGYEVRALPGIRYAIGYLVRRPDVHPALVILDTVDDPNLSEKTVADLHAITGDVPWVVLLSTQHDGQREFLVRHPRTRVLTRPVRVGDIITLVAETLMPSAQRSE